jgi:hypothetical protein
MFRHDENSYSLAGNSQHAVAVPLQMDRNRLTRILAWYLTVCAAYQIVLHFWPGGPPVIAMPRFGVDYILAVTLRGRDSAISLADFPLIAWQMILAVSCFRNRPLLKTYIVSEALLALPGCFWGMALLVGGGGDMFQRSDSLIPLSVILVFSVVPISLGVRILRRRS